MFSGSKSKWPLSHCAVPFLPEFPVHNTTTESSFHVISTIASGAYGEVYKAIHKTDGVTCALKCVSKYKVFQDSAVNQIKDELRILTMCGHHSFLLPCTHHWQNKKSLFIVTPFVDGGDLHQLWQKTGSFDEELIKIFVGELALVLDFLHNAGIIYRDLKMENILIDGDGHVKVIDFGLSKWLSVGNKTSTICGTLQYMAPEVLRRESYTHAIDWWALGILLYALLQGQFPDCEFVDNQSATLKLGEIDPTPSKSVCRLVCGLLKESTERLKSLRALQNHAFFHHFNFDALRSKKIDPLPLVHKQREKRRIVPPTNGNNTRDFESFSLN